MISSSVEAPTRARSCSTRAKRRIVERKIAWGKFFNSGQICMAPDYALVHESVRDEFLDKVRAATAAMGDASRGIIVNDRHAARVTRLIDQAVEEGASVALGGTRHGRTIDATVLTDVPPGSPVMQEEIFGPILPVLTYWSLEEAFAIIEGKEHPLVLYIFSRDRKVARRILQRTRAGGTAINHTLIHFYQLDENDWQ